MRAEAWDHPLVMIGGSDAGAHLDRMCGAPYTTSFLADTLRGRQLVSLERCVQLMTQAPAQLFGLRDRGELREGFNADVVLFDPETVATDEVKLVDDLPGGTARLFADAIGVQRVLVNGTTIVNDGVADRRAAPARCCAPAATPTPCRSPPTSSPCLDGSRPYGGGFGPNTVQAKLGMTCFPMRSIVCMTLSCSILYGLTRHNSRSTPAAS